jgi:hypothetical protein
MKNFVVQSHLWLKAVKYGFDQYSYLFFLSSYAVILGNFFGVSGVTATLLTLCFFYFVGRVHVKLDESAKR